MEKTSYQEKEVSTSNTKRGQYSPRRKDTAPKVNPQLAVELIFQEIKRIEAFTKRIEDATQRKVQIDEKSLENAENSLKSVLSGFEKQLPDEEWWLCGQTYFTLDYTLCRFLPVVCLSDVLLMGGCSKR